MNEKEKTVISKKMEIRGFKRGKNSDSSILRPLPLTQSSDFPDSHGE
jgi:hypothetical protein